MPPTTVAELVASFVRVCIPVAFINRRIYSMYICNQRQWRTYTMLKFCSQVLMTKNPIFLSHKLDIDMVRNEAL